MSTDTAAHIQLNGEPHPITPPHPLTEVLQALDIDSDTQGVAVAINEDVVRREEWADTTLQDGDEVEVIQALQGG
ncbi:MAG: sulfur carrier protein ThiS [Longimonas sp.]|uniref:sulfur carrier protein ThiS n=1 Tax=Longimonas sp. TaxID=2039626 RepID=UPI00335C441F